MEAIKIMESRPELMKIIIQIVNELFLAEQKHLNWPTDAVHAMNILTEEAGELAQAVNDYHYSPDYDPEGLNKLKMEEEARQTAAMSIRFLLNIEQYKNIHTQ